VSQFNARVQQKINAGVPVKHLPHLYLPTSNANKTVVIFTHGLFESPYFFRGINNVFAEQGFVSLSILLPGHWQGDWSSMNSVTYLDWINEMRENVRIAQCFGDKIIFAGHSLGGILSMKAALQYPELTVGLMLWSPAVQINAMPSIGSFIGGLLHINGNIVKGAADLDETPLYAPNAAKQINKLIFHLSNSYGGGKMQGVYSRLAAPTFMAYAENDPAVDVDELTRAAHSIKGLDVKNVMYFPKDTHVWHGNITKSIIDIYRTKPWDYNEKWDDMQAQVENFLQENF
jgi:alpha-beta hydrolase superfamily lysophospholipase